MIRIQCFQPEQTEQVHIFLTVSTSFFLSMDGLPPDEKRFPVCKGTHPTSRPMNGYPYPAHWAERSLRTEMHPFSADAQSDLRALLTHLEPLRTEKALAWPYVCEACGSDMRSLNRELTYGLSPRRVWQHPSTGQRFTLQQAPVGAMWHAFLSEKEPFMLQTPAGRINLATSMKEDGALEVGAWRGSFRDGYLEDYSHEQ